MVQKEAECELDLKEERDARGRERAKEKEKRGAKERRKSKTSRRGNRESRRAGQERPARGEGHGGHLCIILQERSGAAGPPGGPRKEDRGPSRPREPRPNPTFRAAPSWDFPAVRAP